LIFVYGKGDCLSRLLKFFQGMVTEMLGGAPYPYRKEKETHGLIVIVASGIARGRVCTTATTE